ncbi:MAG: hypothetical protein ACXAD7_09150 [Candidatus Kariarchaeaceae archaeon]
MGKTEKLSKIMKLIKVALHSPDRFSPRELEDLKKKAMSLFIQHCNETIVIPNDDYQKVLIILQK